jgi:hypothetical protein
MYCNERPKMHHDMYFINNWYFEINNTYLVLDVEMDEPIKFEFKTMLPFAKVDMKN